MKQKAKKASTKLLRPKGYVPWGGGTITDDELEEFAEQLIEYARDPEVIKLSGFATNHNVPPSTFFHWVTRNRKLKDAVEIANAIIGERREKLGLKGDFNSSIVLKTMPLYDKEYRTMLEWESGLSKKQEAVQNETKIIVLEKYPESDQVPKRIKNED